MRSLLFRINGCGLLLYTLYSAPLVAAQFVDVRAQIEFYDWSMAPGRTVNVHCVVGANSWEMDGGFSGDLHQTNWFTGKRLIEHSVAIRGVLRDDPHPISGEINRVSESADGNPGTLARSPEPPSAR